MKKIFQIIIFTLSLLISQTADQIKKAKEIIQQTGMSEQQVRDAAKSRGYTDKIIDIAIQKKKKLKTKSGKLCIQFTEKIDLPDVGISNEVSRPTV